MVHICSKIKCSCGCEYCPDCFNGCPQCGKGTIEVKTTNTTDFNYIKINKMLNLVEMMGEEREDAPCKYGNIIKGHACYCHNDDSPYRKCPIWRNDEEWNKDNCHLFEKLNNLK